jgi:hypothetical protein
MKNHTLTYVARGRMPGANGRSHAGLEVETHPSAPAGDTSNGALRVPVLPLRHSDCLLHLHLFAIPPDDRLYCLFDVQTGCVERQRIVGRFERRGGPLAVAFVARLQIAT